MKRLFTILSQKWPEYLLEILVITIGILGAFALNNWNDRRKDLEEEQVMLKGLKTEFEQNLVELKSDHRYNQLSLNAAGGLLQRNGQPTPGTVVDSLFAHALNYRTFDPRMGVVSELISSGKLGLIQDEVLRYKLTQWPAELADLEEDNIIRRDTYLSILPTYNTFVSHRNTAFIMTRPNNPTELSIAPVKGAQKKYDALLASSDFDGALYSYFGSQTWVYSNEESIEQFMEETLQLIDENLNP